MWMGGMTDAGNGSFLFSEIVDFAKVTKHSRFKMNFCSDLPLVTEPEPNWGKITTTTTTVQDEPLPDN